MSRKECGIFARIPKEGTSEADNFTIEKEEARQWSSSLNRSIPRKTQLICFPFAGGYSASFRPLHTYLQGECEMLAAEPPGHGTNQMSAVEDFEQLVSLYKQELNLHPDRPFVLLPQYGRHGRFQAGAKAGAGGHLPA